MFFFDSLELTGLLQPGFSRYFFGFAGTYPTPNSSAHLLPSLHLPQCGLMMVKVREAMGGLALGTCGWNSQIQWFATLASPGV